MSYPYSMQSKNGVEFYPMTQHVHGKQTPDEYIEELIISLYDEYIINRRFDYENLDKLFSLVIKKCKEKEI